MRVRIPIMVQDPLTSEVDNIPPIEGFDPANEEFFLDGPVAKRIAVLDFHPETSEIIKGAIFQPPPEDKKRGWYKNENGFNLRKMKGKQMYDPAFMDVSVFAAVLRTLYLFEGTKYASPIHQKRDKDVGETLNQTLGRPLTWAFDSPQLLIIPRAGKWANAFYHRDSHSLQFFYFPSPKNAKEKVYTCLSRDIVAHETGHAIVDGIAPDLLDAVTPQSLAIHEAIADITALLMAFDSNTLRKYVFEKSEGSLEDSNAFSFIAEEFGQVLKGTRGLRNLCNNKSLDTKNEADMVDKYEPHSLSEVLSGALYSVLIKIYEDLKQQYRKKKITVKTKRREYSESGRCLWRAAVRLKRMTFRALDYLPPGEVTFVDFGRAMIAVDKIAYPSDDKMRKWLTDEFLRRKIISDSKKLEVQTDFKKRKIGKDNIETLLKNDWVAHEFAHRPKIRKLLCIPSKRRLLFKKELYQFQIRPRLKLEKKYDYNHPRLGRECLFKVSWNETEKNSVGHNYPDKRIITVGTTLVIDWETNEILTCLTTALSQLSEKEKFQRKESRDIFLKQLAKENLLKRGLLAYDSNGRPLLSAIQTEVIDGVMRVKGTGKFLHIVRR